jgi:2-succinyl-5-enolpyruvyl-6-hydroxy-3-cyclohexene-1-carboxylate synthase
MSQPLPVAVVASALAAGVREFVICAGARNAALISVLAALADKVKLWQHFDERAAGFFALGRILATGQPVAVVTTSGTAAAELLPAVIEAHYQSLPLLAVTADRPSAFRGTGAPQAIEQKNLFGVYAACDDVEFAAPALPVGKWSGPRHLNVCLVEPDSTSFAALQEAAAPLEVLPQSPAPSALAEFPAASPDASILTLAGACQPSQPPGAMALECLQAGGLVSAEAASGLHQFPEISGRLLRCGDASLRHLPLRLVVRTGGVPACRFWRDLEKRADLPVHISPHPAFPGLARNDWQPFAGCLPAAISEAGTIPAEYYLAKDAALHARLLDLLRRFPESEPALVWRLSQAIPRGATVFTGNSMPVREWNLCADHHRAHRVHVLRGANGIDGNLSTFSGIAADAREAWCLTGDLTALYDLNAPWMLRQLPQGRRRFVVMQNAGGKIFSRLPSLKALTPHERSLMENPHEISLRPWAEMWGMDHVRGGAAMLRDPRLNDSLADHAVIELYPDPMHTEAFWTAWAAAEQEVWS